MVPGEGEGCWVAGLLKASMKTQLHFQRPARVEELPMERCQGAGRVKET